MTIEFDESGKIAEAFCGILLFYLAMYWGFVVVLDTSVNPKMMAELAIETLYLCVALTQLEVRENILNSQCQDSLKSYKPRHV